MSLKSKSDYAPAPGELGRRIKSERNRLGLTAAECGARLGISRTAYEQLERSANPQVSRLIGLVRLVGMDARTIVPELVGGGPVPRPKPIKGRRITESDAGGQA